MGEAFIVSGGHISENPTLTISESWLMKVNKEDTEPTVATKTYALESAPSYITINANGENVLRGWFSQGKPTTLPISVSNGSTVTLMERSEYDAWHKLTVKLSGNNVIFTNSALITVYDIEGDIVYGTINTYADMELFIVGTM